MLHVVDAEFGEAMVRETTVDTRMPAVAADTGDRYRQGPWQRAVVALFVVVPTLAVAAAAVVGWGWGLGWRDVGIAAALYLVTGLRDHGRVSPSLHPWLVQGGAATADGIWPSPAAWRSRVR